MRGDERECLRPLRTETVGIEALPARHVDDGVHALDGSPGEHTDGYGDEECPPWRGVAGEGGGRGKHAEADEEQQRKAQLAKVEPLGGHAGEQRGDRRAEDQQVPARVRAVGMGTKGAGDGLGSHVFIIREGGEADKNATQPRG